MTKTMLIHGLILGAAAVALTGCYAGYEAPPPAYPAYSYSYPSYGGYYYGPSASFGFYGEEHRGDWDDWHHGDGD